MDNTTPLKVGDTVTLNSGSPVMTINNVKGRTAECVWFALSDGDVVRSVSVSLAALTPATVKA